LKVSTEFARRRWNVKANHGHGARDASKDETAGTTGFVLMVKDLPARDGYPHPSGHVRHGDKTFQKTAIFFLLLVGFAS